MKNLITIFTFLFLLLKITTGQENIFKPVFIGKDVVDNYITSVGGKDKIEKIQTVKIEGTMNTMGMTLNLMRYIGPDYFYQVLQSNNYCQITAYNDNAEKGWQTYNGKAIDFEKNAIEYYQINSIHCWNFFFDGYDLGIDYVLVENENIDSSLYCVDFIKNGITLTTIYFNKSDFHKVKSVCNGQERYYSNYKKIGESGVMMPFRIITNDTLSVTSYKFNQSFNKKLLDKKSLKIFSAGD